VAFEARPASVEELSEGEPSAMVVENARRKARAVQGDPVLGADTAVALGDRVLGKPGDENQARAFLRALSGATHEVWSGVALIRDGAERTLAARTAVQFRALSQADIEGYVATGEWRERAGGYAIQGRGAALVRSIEGDYFNVVGLPVAALVELDPPLFGPPAHS
jgi:nucleoside triphosphate pyrophosphatase